MFYKRNKLVFAGRQLHPNVAPLIGPQQHPVPTALPLANPRWLGQPLALLRLTLFLVALAQSFTTLGHFIIQTIAVPMPNLGHLSMPHMGRFPAELAMVADQQTDLKWAI